MTGTYTVGDYTACSNCEECGAHATSIHYISIPADVNGVSLGYKKICTACYIAEQAKNEKHVHIHIHIHPPAVLPPLPFAPFTPNLPPIDYGYPFTGQLNPWGEPFKDYWVSNASNIHYH